MNSPRPLPVQTFVGDKEKDEFQLRYLLEIVRIDIQRVDDETRIAAT